VNGRLITGLFAAIGYMALVAVGPASGAEPLPTFQTSAILAGERLTGPDFRIGAVARNDGFLNHFSVTVDGKVHDVAGNALMKVRLAELAALGKMERIKRSDVYIKAVKNAALSPLHAVKNLVTSPVGTVKGIASGVGTFFRGVGHSLFGGRSEQEDNVLKTMVGLDGAKRRFAYQFGIDPYTSFPPVRERLNEIAWAGVAGNLTLSAAFSAIPGPASGALKGTKLAEGMRKLLRDNTPAELKAINERKLARMGVSASIAELFLEHPKFSPTQKTFLVDALSRVRASNRGAFIQRAVLVQDETMAFFMRRWAEMIAAYHQRVAPLARIVRLGMMPIAQRGDGVIVATLPIDHLAWSETIARRHGTNMQSISSIAGVTGGEIWIEGSISRQARDGLEAQNWIVRDNVGSILGMN